MDNPTQEMMREQRENWMLMGAEPVIERGTVRLRQFKKSLPADMPVMVRDADSGERVPFLLRSGQPLLCGDILPERADLALNEDGTLLHQHEFEPRYAQYLDAFRYAEGSEIILEPVPNVARYVNAKHDTWSESGGYVEIDYDPKLDQEFKPKQFFGPDGQMEEEYLAEKEERTDLKSAVQSLAETQAAMAKLLAASAIGPDQIVPVTEDAVEAALTEAAEEAVATEEPASVSPDTVQAANADPEKEQMPCGAWKKAGFKKQHMRFCKDPACETDPGDGDADA